MSPLHDESSPVVGRDCAMVSTWFLEHYIITLVLSLLCFNEYVDAPRLQYITRWQMIQMLWTVNDGSIDRCFVVLCSKESRYACAAETSKRKFATFWRWSQRSCGQTQGLLIVHRFFPSSRQIGVTCGQKRSSSVGLIQRGRAKASSIQKLISSIINERVN